MESLKILIVEDELVIAENIMLMICDMGHEAVAIAKDYESAVEKLNDTSIDVALLDIKLKGKLDGIDLANYIREKYSMAIIYITSYSDKTTINRAKETKPDGYLLKPFDIKDLYSAVEIGYSNFADRLHAEKNLQRLKESTTEHVSNLNSILRDSIFIKKDYLLIKIHFNKIKYLKTDGNYIEIYCTDQKHLVRSTLKDFLKKLPNSQFLQVHKSYSINLNFITAISYNSVLIDKDKIPIGRMFVEEVKKTLNIEI